MDGVDRSMALAAQAFTALFPLLIIVATLTGPDEGNAGTALAKRLSLKGDAADDVRAAFPASAGVSNSITVFSVIVLTVSALSFTRALQRMYEKAWNLQPRGIRDQGWGAIWLVGFAFYVAVQPALKGAADGLTRFLIALALGIGLWLFTPAVILGRRLGWRQLLPQAVFAAIGMTIARVGFQIYMPLAVSRSAKEFGTIGIAFSLVSVLFGISLVLVGSAAIGATIGRRVR